MEVQNNRGKFRFGRITNKYLIADVFAYAGDQRKCLKNLFQINRKLRRLVIENHRLFQQIVRDDKPEFLDARIPKLIDYYVSKSKDTKDPIPPF